MGCCSRSSWHRLPALVVRDHRQPLQRSPRGETWPPLLPGGNFWTNVGEVFDTIPFWLALGNSVLISGIITVSVVGFSTLAGYAFAKLRFRGRNWLMVAVIATMAIPTQLGIIPLFMLMRTLGWTGEIGAVVIPTLVTAFGVFFMRQYLVDVIPDELIESARMDGASMISTFWHVALPAARPAMAILGLFTFMTAWTDFLWPLLVLDAGNPHLADGAQPTAVGPLRGLLDRPGRCRHGNTSAAGPLRHSGTSTYIRNHARSSEG